MGIARGEVGDARSVVSCLGIFSFFFVVAIFRLKCGVSEVAWVQGPVVLEREREGSKTPTRWRWSEE